MSHTYAQNVVHVVFCTKGRRMAWNLIRNMLSGKWRAYGAQISLPFVSQPLRAGLGCDAPTALGGKADSD